MEESKEFDFDQVVENYNEIMATQLGKDNAKFAEYKVELLRKLITDQPHSILNYGCGVGRDMEYFKKYFLKEKDVQLYGCDISKESIEYAARSFPDVNWFHSDTTESLYQQNCKYDLVFIACVFHHIDPAIRSEWVKAIADNVNPGGYICVFEHNLINPYTRHIIVHPVIDPQDNPAWMLKHKEIEELLLASDRRMRIFWSGYTLFSPIRKPWITSVEKHLGWCPLGAQQCVIVRKDSPE